MILLYLFSSLFVFLSLCRTAASTALTTAISANERLCFYVDVDKAGEKIGVRGDLNNLASSHINDC